MSTRTGITQVCHSLRLSLMLVDTSETCVKSRVGLPDIANSSTFWLQGNEVHVYWAGVHLCVVWQAATKRKPVLMLSTSEYYFWGDNA